MDIQDYDKFKTSRLCYMMICLIENVIYVLTSSTYLAKLSLYLGFSDGMAGLLNSLITFSAFFQITMLFINIRGSVKRVVTCSMLISQLLLSSIFFIPFVPAIKNSGAVFLFAFIVVGQMLANVVNPMRFIWFINLVRDDKRGIFMAKNEMTTLLITILFSISAGAVLDHFEAKGRITDAFLIYGISLYVLIVIYFVFYVIAKENPEDTDSKNRLGVLQGLKETFSNKNLIAMLPIQVLYAAAAAPIPFFATYRINELGMSMTFVSLIGIVYSLFRVAVSIPIGRLGDRRGFITQLNVAFALDAVGYFLCIFTGSSIGLILFIIFESLHSMSMAGANSGRSNLLFDYVPHRLRTKALTLFSVCYGLSGLIMSFFYSRLVDYVQKCGNKFLFIDGVYAQQVLAALSIIAFILLIIYINTVTRRLTPVSRKEKYEI